MSTPVTVTALGPERRDDVRHLDELAFSYVNADPEAATATLEWDRVFGATTSDDRVLAGIYGVYSLRLAVPRGPEGAAVVPMAGLTWVGVDPGQRRRGVATAMLRHHLHGLHESGGEAVSGLNASEPSIYGRFGYGLASSALTLRLRRGAALREVPGSDQVAVRVETADPERHGDLVADLHERACQQRPGMIALSAPMRARELLDPPHRRKDREPLRLVVAERDGRPTGYALMRRALAFTDGAADGVADVHDVVALDAATARALWGVLLDLDLMTSVNSPLVAGDDPLLALLVDVRSARPTRRDVLWVRLVDVDRALAQRTYAVDLDVVVDVIDPFCPWNARRWRLSGGPDGATCEPTSDPADVSLDVRELAATYLGGTSLVSLATAGLVAQHRAGAVARLSTALRSGLEPVSPHGF